MNDELNRLARAIANPNPEVDRPQTVMRTGTVTNTAPLTVQLVDGTSVQGVKRLSSYTPATSDVVRFEQYGPTLLILGKIV